jgi:hypothetical protein
VNVDRVRELLLLPTCIIILLAFVASLADAMLAQQFVPLEVTMPLTLMFGGFLFGSSIVKRAVGPRE